VSPNTAFQGKNGLQIGKVWRRLAAVLNFAFCSHRKEEIRASCKQNEGRKKHKLRGKVSQRVKHQQEERRDHCGVEKMKFRSSEDAACCIKALRKKGT
jgi:hypothetical protein